MKSASMSRKTLVNWHQHRWWRVKMEMAICIEKLFMMLLTWHVALKGNHNTPQAPI